MDETLRAKIIVQSIISILVIAFIISFSIWSFNRSKDELVKTYSNYTLAVAKNNANKLQEQFNYLTLLFDYVSDSLTSSGISERTLKNPYFEKVYSSIAEDFFIFDENGNIIYSSENILIEREQLKSVFLDVMQAERGLQTPRLSEFYTIKIKERASGIFLFFKQFILQENHKKIYLTFLISEQRIMDNYINSLHLSNKGYAYIIDDDQIVIASGKQEQIGKSFEEIEANELQKLLKKGRGKSERELERIKALFKQHKKQKEIVFEKMTLGEEGKERYMLQTSTDKFELVSFYPIKIPGDIWSFAIKTPYSFVTERFKKSFEEAIYLTAILIVILFINYIHIIHQYRKRLKAEFEINHISALLEKEQELRKAEYRYKQLYQRTKDIILICDDNFVIEEINYAGVEIIGKNIKEITNKMKFPDRFINISDFMKFTNILEKSSSVVKFSGEVFVDDRIQYFEINAEKHFDEKEKRDYIYFVIRDVTEHKHLQDEIIKKEKLESAMALVVTANHKINNPLAGISLHLELLKGIVSEDDDKIIKILDDINRNVFRISDVLKSLNDIDEINEKDYINAVKMLEIEKH